MVQDTIMAAPRKLVISGAAGISWFAAIPGLPSHLETRVHRLGPSFSGRVMWHPGYLLRAGIESGHTHLYSYDLEAAGTSGSVRLDGVPLLVQFAMPVGERVEVYAGYGTYRLTSTLDFLGRVRTSFFSQGYSAALAYRIPLQDRWGMVMELKWMNAFVTGHHVLALQWRMDLDAWRW